MTYVLNGLRFYLTSYIIYLLDSQQPLYHGLTQKGNIQDANPWPHVVCPQLVKENILEHSKECRIVNYAFIFAIIWLIEGDYSKRMFIEATTEFKELGGIFLQFKTFTYIMVSRLEVKPKKLSKYPPKHLILLEIAR